MRLTKRDRELGDKIYATYSTKRGSIHIAERAALHYLAACVRHYRPKVVVELGAGIGTCTTLMLETDIERLISLEPDAFCLGALVELQTDPRLTIVTSVAVLEALKLKADLVVIDGGFESEAEYSLIGPGTVVFVEGIRQAARDKLRAFLARREMSIGFREYGAHYVLLWSRDHWFPRPLGFTQVRKGCFIGQVKETPCQT